MADFNGFNTTPEPHALIKVVGCGGGGSNAVDRMVADGVQGVVFIEAVVASSARGARWVRLPNAAATPPLKP